MSVAWDFSGTPILSHNLESQEFESEDFHLNVNCVLYEISCLLGFFGDTKLFLFTCLFLLQIIFIINITCS